MSFNKLQMAAAAVAATGAALAATPAAAQGNNPPQPPITDPGSPGTVPGGTGGCNGKPCPQDPGTPQLPGQNQQQQQQQQQQQNVSIRNKSAASAGTIVNAVPPCSIGGGAYVGTVPATFGASGSVPSMPCHVVTGPANTAIAVGIQTNNAAAAASGFAMVREHDEGTGRALDRTAYGARKCGTKDFFGMISGECTGNFQAVSHAKAAYKPKRRAAAAPAPENCIPRAKLCPR